MRETSWWLSSEALKTDKIKVGLVGSCLVWWWHDTLRGVSGFYLQCHLFGWKPGSLFFRKKTAKINICLQVAIPLLSRDTSLPAVPFVSLGRLEIDLLSWNSFGLMPRKVRHYQKIVVGKRLRKQTNPRWWEERKNQEEVRWWLMWIHCF